MADKSAIEWTDATWNPIVGCSIVSPGCTHCYAMGMAARIEAMTAALTKTGQGGAPHYNGTTRKVNGKTRGGERSEQGSKSVWTGKVALAPDHILQQPLTWRAPRRIFVNSMGDLFHEDVPDEWIDKVFAIMALCAGPHSPLRGSSPLAPQHTFQVLTKRAWRMREYLASAQDRVGEMVFVNALRGAGSVDAEAWRHAKNRPWPLPNVWLGVSAERQQEADERIPELLATPAAIRFVSAEPLLGPIDFYETSAAMPIEGHPWKNGPILQGIDWIIVGGESGPGARPMHPAWARAIRDQCAAAGVPFFFKQWGMWRPSTPELAAGNPRSGWRCLAAHPHVPRAAELYPEAGAEFIEHVGKKAAGRLLDGIEHNAMPTKSA